MKITTITTKQFIEGVDMEKIFESQSDGWNGFYEASFDFSYSSINRLLYCPEIFYKEYILKQKEEKLESYLTEGKLIHCLLLEPENFDEMFATMTTKLPSDNARIVVERVFNHHQELLAVGATDKKSLQEYSGAIIDVLKDINLYQSLKTDEQRVEKMVTPENVNYWEFLTTSKGKTLVDFDTLEKCKNIVEKIRQDKKISEILNLNGDSEWWSTVERFNELPLRMDLKKFSFGLKGIIDNIVVDPNKQLIRINDIKTTSKTLKDFPESVKIYRYDLQAAIYKLLVTNHFKDLIKEGYKIEVRFIVVDKNSQVYAFVVSEDTMTEWMKNLQLALEAADYHYTNKDYTLPKEFLDGVVL